MFSETGGKVEIFIVTDHCHIVAAIGFTKVLRRFYEGFMKVLRRFYEGFMKVLRRFYEGFTKVH